MEAAAQAVLMAQAELAEGIAERMLVERAVAVRMEALPGRLIQAEHPALAATTGRVGVVAMELITQPAMALMAIAAQAAAVATAALVHGFMGDGDQPMVCCHRSTELAPAAVAAPAAGLTPAAEAMAAMAAGLAAAVALAATAAQLAVPVAVEVREWSC
jgi:hypothetical protein